jgi:alpha-L-fucosidase
LSSMEEKIHEPTLIHGIIKPTQQTGHGVVSIRAQTSIITDAPQPNHYSGVEHFKQAEWDKYSFATPDEMKWWIDAKFGMFIHWGPCTLIGAEIGWSRGSTRGPEQPGDEVPVEIYDNLYKQFNPIKFNADEWVEIAKEAGQKYMVFIAKHHDGFCLWDTKTTDYNIMHTPLGRDVLIELADACEKAGIALGIYFSQRDWYHPDYFGAHHERYVAYMHEQVNELLTNYGKIRILWLDAWYPSKFLPEHWDSMELYVRARKLQPGIVINNRSSVPGDYDTPELVIGAYQTHRPWESANTIHHDCWSWNPDCGLKSLKECLDIVVGCAVGGGNVLLNVAPTAEGEIELEHAERFKEIGKWLSSYGDSIYGTRGGPVPSSEWGGCTWKENKIYVHVLYWTGIAEGKEWHKDSLCIPDIENKLTSYKVLTGGKASVRQTAEGIEISISEQHRDPLDSIIELTFEHAIEGIIPDPRNGTTLV